MNSKLIRGVQYAAWAYFFLYLDINLNRFSLLPNAVGWYLLSRAVTALEEEHPDLRLLGPLTFPLGLWALKQYAFLLPAWDLSQFSWLLSWLALAVELTTLYFHFQFLTDLADIAARHAGETGRDFSPALLRARTVVTVLSTAASVLFYLGVDSSGPLSSFSIALTLFLLAVLVVTPLFGLLSTMVVESRMAFFSDALGHSAFTGIAIGTLCGLADPLWMAVLLAAVFALLFTYVRRKSNMASDTVIGVFSSTAVALGIFIATFGGGSFTQYNSLLIGDILSVEPAKIALLAVILLVVVLLWLCSFNQLMLSSIHPALADSRGVGVFWQGAVFSAAIAVVVTVSMTWVGLLVINSLLVPPAAAARNISRNMFQYPLCSLLFAVGAGIAGLMTSYYIGSSAGASITLYLAGIFLVTFLLRKRG